MKQRKILIIHESKVMMSMIEDYILSELLDIQTTKVRTLEEAEEILKNKSLDVIVSSYQQRTMHGGQILDIKRSYSINEKTPLILLTFTDTQRHAEELKLRGIDHFLMPPHTPEMLRDKINEVCDPVKKRAFRRYNVPGINLTLHIRDADLEASVINISQNSFLVELEWDGLDGRLMETNYVSAHFPDSYDNHTVREIWCKFLSIKTITWDDSKRPRKVQLVLIILEIATDKALFLQVMRKVEENAEKLSLLEI